MRIKINKYEILAYLIIVLLVYVVIIADVLLYNKPNLSLPDRVNLPDVEPISISFNPGQPQTSGLSTVLVILKFLLIIAVAIFGLYFLSKMSQWSKSGLFGFAKSPKKLKEKIKKVKDARTEAYRIIEEGLSNGFYTNSFIDAYHALDDSLNYFRDLKRPKHWTPKEYAYTVVEPVFQPSVYRFVSKFYDLRYGLHEANMQDLIDFRLQLDYLFVDDIPGDTKQVWEKEYYDIKHSRTIYSIPRFYDPRKPRGGQ